MRTDVYGTEQFGLVVGIRVEPLKWAVFLRFLGAFAKLRQGTIGVVMSVFFAYPSVRPYGTNLGSHWMDCHEN